jgi:hypothetical protein
MGDAPEQVAHEQQMADAQAMRPIDDGGIASALIGPTCSTGRL